jgi:serine/threonine-protein kinase ATR
MLGHAVCSIFSQLGKENPAIKGTAYMQASSSIFRTTWTLTSYVSQLAALAKHLNKSHYDLLASYMSQISVFAVSRMISQPSLLTQLSRFVSMDSPELVRHTLSDTLPYLFVNRNDRVLDAIGAELGEKVSTLLMEHSSDILARVFLLPNDADTSITLTFIVKTLNDDTKGNSDIQVKNIVQTCYIPLLAELVIVMGEEGGARTGNVSTRGVS